MLIAKFPSIAKSIAKSIIRILKYCKFSKYCKNYCYISRNEIFKLCYSLLNFYW